MAILQYLPAITKAGKSLLNSFSNTLQTKKQDAQNIAQRTAAAPVDLRVGAPKIAPATTSLSQGTVAPKTMSVGGQTYGVKSATPPVQPVLAKAQPTAQPTTQPLVQQPFSQQPTISDSGMLSDMRKYEALKNISSATPPVTPIAKTMDAPKNTGNIAMLPKDSPKAPQTPPVTSETRNKYLAMFNPSSEETDLQKRLSDLTAQQDSLSASESLGLANVEDQPIAMNFITGQQASLTRQAAAKQQALQAQQKPLLERLAQLQANRQSQAKLLEAQLGFETEDAKANAPQYQEIGGNLLRINPATNQVETVFNAPSKEAEGFTLGEGQLRYDANGKLIASGGTKQQDPLDIQKRELEIQKLQQDLSDRGIALSGYQLQDAITKGYTSEAQLKLYAQQTEQGVNPVAIKEETSEAKKLNAIAQSALSDLSYIRGQVTSNLGSGKFLNPTYKFHEENLVDSIGRLRSGGAITEDEEKRFLKLVPGMLEPDSTRIAKLNQLEQIFNSVTSRQSSQGQGDELDSILGEIGFKNVGSDTKQATLPKEMSTVNSLMGKGTITGYGSKFWKPGLDFVLPGGKNASVTVPKNSVVIATDPASKTGGFGNRVKIRTEDGQEMWLSHLDSINVSPGQRLAQGQAVGRQGNTGKTYGKTGIHVDITMPNPNGGYYTAQEVARYLNTIG